MKGSCLKSNEENEKHMKNQKTPNIIKEDKPSSLLKGTRESQLTNSGASLRDGLGRID